MCDKSESLRIRDEAYELCRNVFKDKLTDCYLYGSYARGDYHKDSDVDIMMVVDLDYHDIAAYDDDIAEVGSNLSLKYDVTVSLKIQPKAVLERYKDILPFYKNVLMEGLRYDG